MNLQEKKELLFRRQEGRKVLPVYLEELNALFNYPITEDNLLSLEKTDEIRKSGLIKTDTLTKIAKTLPFQDKHTLQKLISSLVEYYSGPIVIFTDYSKYCGAALLSSLKYFNVQFKLQDEHAGIVSILSEDLENKLIIDFYLDQGIYQIDVETRGQLWGKASF